MPEGNDNRARGRKTPVVCSCGSEWSSTVIARVLGVSPLDIPADLTLHTCPSCHPGSPVRGSTPGSTPETVSTPPVPGSTPPSRSTSSPSPTPRHPASPAPPAGTQQPPRRGRGRVHLPDPPPDPRDEGLTALITLFAYNFGSNLEEKPGRGILDAILTPNRKVMNQIRTGKVPPIIKEQIRRERARNRAARKKLEMLLRNRDRERDERNRG